MARLSDVIIRSVAGPEIGVASTKAYHARKLLLVFIGWHNLHSCEVKFRQRKKAQLLQNWLDLLKRLMKF